MCTKQKGLYKYEIKKLLVFYFLLFIFFIFYEKDHTYWVSFEVGNIITKTIDYSINFKILDPDFSSLYSVIIFILAYIQFKNNFKYMQYYSQSGNKDLITTKLITGVFTIFLFAFITGVIVFFRFNDYSKIYKDALLTLNIDPAIISLRFIILTVFTIFAVYVYIYFFTVLMQYFMGSCIYGIFLSLLLLHFPMLIIYSFDLLKIIPGEIFCLFCPHYFCSTYKFFDNDYYDNLGVHINTGIFNRFNISSVIFYLILSAISLIVIRKLSMSQKFIEQDKPFAVKWTSLIFKLVCTADFFLIGLLLMFMENNIFGSILVSIFFGVFGFALSHTIVKNKEVS